MNVEFGRRNRPERVTPAPAKQEEAFDAEKMGAYQDVAHRDEEMRRLLEARANILEFAAVDSTPDDGRRLRELEKQIAARHERSWRER